MTALNVTKVEALAQESYQFVNNRFADYAAPVLTLLHDLGIDHAAFMKLEPAINAAINDAEHKAFVAGFTFSSAIANVPLFSTDPMDAVLMPDRYVGQ